MVNFNSLKENHPVLNFSKIEIDINAYAAIIKILINHNE